MYDEVCYKKPFLKEVILRLDFGAPIDAFRRGLPQKIAGLALQRFPIAEQQKSKSHSVILSDAGMQATQEDSMQWLYHGRDREKTLAIAPEALIVSHRAYESYEGLKGEVDPVIDALYESQKDLAVSRLGLRYVNVLELEEGDPLSWAEFVRQELLATIETYRGTGQLARAFQIVEFNDDGRQTKFQFGIVNPDYPALIKRRNFVLDIDSFYQGALSRAEVAESIGIAHGKIQDLFETSITPAARTRMGQAVNAN